MQRQLASAAGSRCGRRRAARDAHSSCPGHSGMALGSGSQGFYGGGEQRHGVKQKPDVGIAVGD